MKPELNELLRTSAMQLPGLAAPTAYAQASAGLITLMLMISAAEQDRVADNREMRALFAELGPGVRDAALQARMNAAAATSDASLRISALNAAGGELRKLLIDVQTHAEETGDVDAQKRVWAVLRGYAERHMMMPGM